MADVAHVVPLVVAAALAVLVGLRVAGCERGRPVVAAVALTPYGFPVALIATVLAAGAHRWSVTASLLALGAVLGVLVLPRVARTAVPPPPGHALRVLSANLLSGRADAQAVVDMVRRHAPDVLCLQELSTELAQELKAAGLGAELPYMDFDKVGDGRRGVGIASRHPIRHRSRDDPFTAGAVLRPPGRPEVEVISVHPTFPMGRRGTGPWLAALAALPRAVTTGPVRVLAGDFNATVDHASFRRLLRSGYRDAGMETGSGLRHTWPGAVSRWAPRVTLDHVLIDRRGHVRSCTALDLPGSDHRAVLAELVLPEPLTFEE